MVVQPLSAGLDGGLLPRGHGDAVVLGHGGLAAVLDLLSVHEGIQRLGVGRESEDRYAVTRLDPLSRCKG
jgi:hypothetical protein